MSTKPFSSTGLVLILAFLVLLLLLHIMVGTLSVLAFTTPYISRHDVTAPRTTRRTLLWGSSTKEVSPPLPPPGLVSYWKNATSSSSSSQEGTATTVTGTPPTTNNNMAGAGALSMTIDELTPILGGRKGRAQLVWDCYAIGVDPALYYSDYYHHCDTTSSVISQEPLGGMMMNSNEDDSYDYEAIRQALPSTRRQTRLGREALQKLAQTYAPTCTSTSIDSDSSTAAPFPLRVEGGVASLVHVSRSADGTTKMLLQMRDGLQVETVIIPIDKKKGNNKVKNKSNEKEQKQPQLKRASTVCLSSQVGCRQACTFCATGRMGIQRSLTSDEILAQYYFATKLTRLYGNDDLPRINNVVFMGMGDAADNAVAVTRAVRILTSQFQLAAQKVTVSTVGPTPRAFIDLTTTTPDAPCVLAWSVHAAKDEIRHRLVPTMKSRGYSVAELRNGLIQALLQKPVHLRTTMLQVTLLKNINDSLEQADEMAILAESIVQAVPGCKLIVNLIPWNDINHDNDIKKQQQQHDADVSSSSPLHYQRPSFATVDAFQERLWQRGIFAQVRTTRGDDSLAACGQLATITATAKKAAAAAAPA